MSRGLGKGLSAFFPEGWEEQEDVVQDIPVKELRPNPYQPRKTFPKEAINELKSSVKTHGILQPIIVRKSIKGYEIVVGERRFRAAQELKLEKVPAVVKDLTDEKMMEIALIENLQREDLNPLEEAEAYERLMTQLNVTQEALAKRLGKSRPHIANHLRLIQLPPSIQKRIVNKQLSMGHGRALLGLKRPEQLEEAAKVIEKKGLNVRQAEELVQQMNGRVSRETSKKKKNVSPYVKHQEETLGSYFGTSVSIKQGKKKGKIEIEFFTEDDLARILELIGQDDEQ
ncbi:ParB/RepB/Spo0J family partition protein [Salsuginibacillus kocurii]|uniref:ParB/RepB/Spo0J family partition protein n=1 Tax=Salsuginibacillus kocurii TaxID=427078 RepID=UPI0003658935|nr:ParB/RepB/Spo0J family partition protein [Salsuginibacillus kocurii]